jgi:hypothetical protein
MKNVVFWDRDGHLWRGIEIVKFSIKEMSPSPHVFAVALKYSQSRHKWSSELLLSSASCRESVLDCRVGTSTCDDTQLSL